MSKTHRMWIALWCAWLLVPATFALLVLRHVQAATAQTMIEREAVARTLDRDTPPGPGAVTPVKVSLTLEQIEDFSFTRSMWSATFHMTFEWDGTLADPGESLDVRYGSILSRTRLRVTQDGVHHRSEYRLTAGASNALRSDRFPLDSHALSLTFVAEHDGPVSFQVTGDSHVGRSAFYAGYTLGTGRLVGKPSGHAFTFELPLLRTSLAYFLKLMFPLFLAVALSALGLLIKGPNERLALSSTAIFIAVMNGISVQAPSTGETLLDHLNWVGYLTIGQFLVQAIVYHRLLAAPHEATRSCAHIIDVCTVAIAPVVYVVLSAALIAS